MTDLQIPSLIAAFGAGVLSVLSPCVLPLLPAVMAYSSERGKLRPLAIVIGLCISFTAMGVIFSAFGSVVYAYRGYMEMIAEIMIIALGIVMLFDLPIFDRLSALAPQLAPQTTQGEGIMGGLLLGLSLGIVWMPCLGPLIGSVLMTVIPEGDILYGGTLLFIYSLGLAIPMLGIAYATSTLTGHVRVLSLHSMAIRRIAGGVLILVGLGMVFGVYNLFWGWVVNAVYAI
ncbi:MAG: cytochrome C biogenesis protein [Candidatus Methanogaster sp.]|uniref:Cytochrome C biogenesis protein n=1 Tax=Candidatus Methanogaster sp. TaxID=3386292 RepID=A0AC61L560_9EURY|nr:MAG: cytochrome C biogenesis protein [ANME-2 cluster archaeon]